MPKITGMDRHLGRVRGMTGQQAVRRIGAALFAGGSLIETDAAISITNGAISGRNHVPSRPGEPPNADTHLLDRSIETALVEPLKVHVTANAPYAAALEFGTSKMAERPYMRPATEKNRGEVVDLVRDAINNLAKGT